MGKVIPFERSGWVRNRPRKGAGRRNRLQWLPLALLIAVAACLYIAADVSPRVLDPDAPSRTGNRSRVSDSFGRCYFPLQADCVIDGDTLRYDGEMIRVADIDTPETSSPKCAREAALGAKVTRRFIELLNDGPFEIVSDGRRDTDRYGRKLRLLRRDGRSLGSILVAEGLAQRWSEPERNWCA